MRTTSGERQVVRSDLKGFRFSTPEGIFMISAVLVLFAFVLLPWLSEAGQDVTGIGLLTASTVPISADLQNMIGETLWTLVLIPAGAILAFVSNRMDENYCSSATPCGAIRQVGRAGEPRLFPADRRPRSPEHHHRPDAVFRGWLLACLLRGSCAGRRFVQCSSC